MTDINFYVSKRDGFEHRLTIALKLIGYALNRKMFIHVHTDDENMNKRVDDLLWTADKNSFIPHQIIHNSQEQETQSLITISHDYEPMENCDYLINLSSERPKIFSRFLKLAEIIDNSEDVLAAGRNRYAFYRDRGYNLAYHKL